MSNSVFSDFCQAWVARFPGSELPAAWEEDVRANLKKHKSKVAILKEEIEKEEMYVEYLDKLLADIERHRKNESALITANNGDSMTSENHEEEEQEVLPQSKQKFLDDQVEGYGCRKAKKADLRLDLKSKESPSTAEETSFVTVINVPSPNGKGHAGANDSRKTKSESALKKVPPPKPPPKTSKRTSLDSKVTKGSRDSLNSVSSPTTPSSMLEEYFASTPREGMNTDLLTPQTNVRLLGASGSPTSSEDNQKEQDDEEELIVEEKVHEDGQSEEDDEFDLRGRPDGRDNEIKTSSQQPSLKRASKIKDLMANWENKPPISIRPMSSARDAVLSMDPASRTQRKDSDNSNSSRGRMGSPSGKSHDSSDSETSLSRKSNKNNKSSNRLDVKEMSPGSRRRRVIPGETRLDRLVRRPSGERNGSSRHSEALPAPLPKPMKKPLAKPRSVSKEHLYDVVAIDEQEDVYDNHLLYGTNSTRVSDGRKSDLGFVDDDTIPTSSFRSGTLSSSDTEGLHTATATSSPGLGRESSVEEESNYVNIQYFLNRKDTTTSLRKAAKNHGSPSAMNTVHSDDELESDERVSSSSKEDLLDGGVGVSKSRKEISGDDDSRTFDAESLMMYKCILNSIVESEAIYLEALSVMLQYMKAMKVTLSTPQPVIPKEEFDVIFYKIPELHELHLTFHENLKKQVERWNGVDAIGHNFKMLASRTKTYGAFLNNYQAALDALHRCSESYPQFGDLTKSIKLRSVKGQRQGQSLSLEDLLHKPVARVQKLSLCLQDLIKYTPESHPDFKSLNEALDKVQAFLSEYNDLHAGELFPHQERQQRHLVKNSFIVELADGHRKLRHLFLFNDVLVCAKYKASSKKSEKFTFLLKWYIPLWNVLIVEEPSCEPKENTPANLVSIKTQAAALRDQILRIEKEEEWKGSRKASSHGNSSASAPMSAGQTSFSKSTEKHRKKLAELEAQLVLALPNLVFQVTHKQTGRAYTFFLSSEYERSQWVETLQVLQSSLPANPSVQVQKSMSMEELQAWITSCRNFLKTNMGSFLMRSPRDEALLVGDLYFQLKHLQGLTRPADLFVIVEVDSYGHFSRRAKSTVIRNSMEPSWSEDFIIELEGSENLRILVYEQNQGSLILRGRATLELSRTWLNKEMAEQRISMNDVVLTCGMKFVTFEETLRRVPQQSRSLSSNSSLFGGPIEACAKREKRAVPFIITSCVREVERRGISEVGIYRVSGSAADVTRLKKAYETNPYEAEQLLKECDIHSVAGILKLYLRELPESIFTNAIYKLMFEAYHEQNEEKRKHLYLNLFSQIPQSPNQACIVFLIEHIVRVSQYEAQNKMSLHNLATVFGPTLLHAGGGDGSSGKKKDAAKDQLATSTVDVMAQAGILHFFITRRARGEPIQIVERQV